MEKKIKKNDSIQDKFIVSANEEFNSLRQEILNRIGYDFMLLNIHLTISGVLLGFGINNSLVALILPPISLFLVFAKKTNTENYLKISNYLSENYSLDNTGTNWEVFNQKFSKPIKGFKIQRVISGIGMIGIFITPSIIAIILGYISYDCSILQTTMILIDGISVLLIIFTFYFYRTSRIRRIVNKELELFYQKKD